LLSKDQLKNEDRKLQALKLLKPRFLIRFARSIRIMYIELPIPLIPSREGGSHDLTQTDAGACRSGSRMVGSEVNRRSVWRSSNSSGFSCIRALYPHEGTLIAFKDMAVQEYEDGFLLSEVPLGDGILDLKQIAQMLRKTDPKMIFNLLDRHYIP
jgi:hypothetical protein